MRASEAMRRWLRWESGRQGTGYDKLLLATGPLPVPFDCYLLRFPPGTEVPPHRDALETGRHYRLNVVLRGAERGGEFVCSDPLFASRHIKLFRPDRSVHAVTRVEGRTRWVLSVGWVLRGA